MTDDLALFDVPTPRPTGSSRVERGQHRGAYRRTVVAEVQVTDAASLCAAAVRDFDTAPSVTIPWARYEDGGADLPAEQDEQHSHRDRLRGEPAAALAWLVEPVGAHAVLAEAGAARIYASKVEVDELDEPWLRLWWAVELRLRNVAAFRRVALDSNPRADPTKVTNSFAAAWSCAAQPYAPLLGIPGIAWSPVDVRVEPISSRRSRRSPSG